MNLSFRSHLRTRLVVLALVAVVPALAVTAYTQAIERQRARARTVQDNLQLVRLAADRTAAVFDGAQRVLQTLGRFPAIRANDPAPCDALLLEILHDHPGFAGFGVLHRDGSTFCGSARTKPLPQNGDRPWFQRAIQTRTTTLGGFQISRVTGNPDIVMAHPLLDPTGAVEYVIIAAIEIEQFSRTAALLRLPPGATLTLFDRDRIILARYPDGQRWVGQKLPDTPSVRRTIEGSDQALFEATGIDGVARLFTTVPVKVDFDTGLSVSLGIERTTIFAEVNRTLRKQLELLALVMLVAVGAALSGAERLVLRPIQALKSLTERLAAGDLGARAQLRAGALGLSDLGDAINTMAVALEARERERHLLEDQLRQTQKIEAVGRLAGGIAHDFNNLLTAILGYGELAVARLADDDPTKGDLHEMLKAGERAAQLTKQLLAFSRQQPVQPQILDLNQLVANLDKMLRRVIGENIQLTVQLANGLWATKVDPGQIEQVIVNFVVNARDAMPDGGQLRLETENAAIDERVASGHPGLGPGEYVVLRVSDTGCGMTDDVRARLFEPFFTTKALGKGTGLGLATVYGIVKQSGGYLAVDTAPGRGSIFTVYLPRATEPITDQVEHPPAYLRRGTETILLVEDEIGVRHLAARILGRHGYVILEADSGEQAMEVYQTHAGAIDLVLTDVVMPGMNGYTLARNLRRLKPTMKVLWISGYSDRAIFEPPDGDRAPTVLMKPFKAQELAAAVRNVLDRVVSS